jgi:hypothetical protein
VRDLARQIASMAFVIGFSVQNVRFMNEADRVFPGCLPLIALPSKLR